MIDNAPSVLLTLATLSTIIMIGVGFLARPSREGALWSIAFTAAMVGGYFEMSYQMSGAGWLRGVGTGLTLLALGLVWVGIRMRGRRRRSMLWPVVAGAVLLGAALSLALGDGSLTNSVADTGVVSLALAAAVAVEIATIFELLRIRTPQRAVLVPLTVASGIAAAYAAIWLAAVLTGRLDGVLTDALPSAQSFSFVIRTILIFCALVTLLLLARGDVTADEPVAESAFTLVARDRLARAERFDDAWWSLLEVRLDDPDVLREASSSLAYARVLDRFGSDVSAVFPAEADIERVDPSTFRVLLPRHESAVRPILRVLLERVATLSSDQSLEVRLSASIGWAPVSSFGYDLDHLVSAASAAADRAQLSGGDGWHRATVTVDPAP